jgi:hypothetical protein
MQKGVWGWEICSQCTYVRGIPALCAPLLFFYFIFCLSCLAVLCWQFFVESSGTRREEYVCCVHLVLMFSVQKRYILTEVHCAASVSPTPHCPPPATTLPLLYTQERIILHPRFPFSIAAYFSYEIWRTNSSMVFFQGNLTEYVYIIFFKGFGGPHSP